MHLFIIIVLAGLFIRNAKLLIGILLIVALNAIAFGLP